MIRNITFGVELEGESNVERGLFADGMEVHLEVHLGPGFDQPARPLRKDVASLADRILIEEDSLLSYLERPIGSIELTAVAGLVRGLHDRRSYMVDHGESLDRDDLHTPDISILR